jgi:hypothetical protein
MPPQMATLAYASETTSETGQQALERARVEPSNGKIAATYGPETAEG